MLKQMMRAFCRGLRGAARKASKPARLRINTWQQQQSEAQVKLLGESAARARELEQDQHRRQVQLSIRRNEIERN